MVNTHGLLVRIRHTPILRLVIVAQTVMLLLSCTAVGTAKAVTPPEEISLGTKGVPKKETDSFAWMPVRSFKANEKIPAMLEIGGGSSEVWSVERYKFHIGKIIVNCPIMSVIPEDKGSSLAMIAGFLRAKINIRDGLNSDGYRIEAVREIKAGQSFAALMVIGDNHSSVLSIESTKDRKPLFAAFEKTMKPKECASAVEIWRRVIEHIGHNDGSR